MPPKKLKQTAKKILPRKDIPDVETETDSDASVVQPGASKSMEEAVLKLCDTITSRSSAASSIQSVVEAASSPRQAYCQYLAAEVKLLTEEQWLLFQQQTFDALLQFKRQRLHYNRASLVVIDRGPQVPLQYQAHLGHFKMNNNFKEVTGCVRHLSLSSALGANYPRQAPI
jgi:hypothetical protein